MPVERTITEVEVFQEDGSRPIAWRVEVYYSDGAVDVNIFSDGDAKKRAVEYAAWKYGRCPGADGTS